MYQQIQQLQQHQLHLHPKHQQWICGELFADISSRHDWSRARESHAATTWQNRFQARLQLYNSNNNININPWLISNVI
jgi:hypothetical protein